MFSVMQYVSIALMSTLIAQSEPLEASSLFALLDCVLKDLSNIEHGHFRMNITKYSVYKIVAKSQNS